MDLYTHITHVRAPPPAQLKESPRKRVKMARSSTLNPLAPEFVPREDGATGDHRHSCADDGDDDDDDSDEIEEVTAPILREFSNDMFDFFFQTGPTDK